jgi:hypothetical protein
MALGFVFVAGREERAQEGKWSAPGEREGLVHDLIHHARVGGAGTNSEERPAPSRSRQCGGRRRPRLLFFFFAKNPLSLFRL